MDYYNTVRKMEEAGVNDNYIQGWIAGYLNNPEIEEQRITAEYELGYKDGKENLDDNFLNFC